MRYYRRTLERARALLEDHYVGVVHREFMVDFVVFRFHDASLRLVAKAPTGRELLRRSPVTKRSEFLLGERRRLAD